MFQGHGNQTTYVCLNMCEAPKKKIGVNLGCAKHFIEDLYKSNAKFRKIKNFKVILRTKEHFAFFKELKEQKERNSSPVT